MTIELTAERTERRLATIETITSVRPIDGADAIEACRVRGWDVVTRKGEFAPGDQALYLEIDSALPLADPRFAFLAPRGTRLIDGQPHHVLKAAKLRGTYSMGLLIPAGLFPELDALEPGADLAAAIGVTKYEPAIPAGLAGTIAGPFPTRFAPKTDAERVQNLVDAYPAIAAKAFTATEKVDGMSVTMVNDGGTLRVATRNWELAAPEAGTRAPGPWAIADQLRVLERLPDGHTLQGELWGEGIHGNKLKAKGLHLAVFNALRFGRYLPRHEWPAALAELAAPIYEGLELPETVDEAIAQADGIKSLINPAVLAEGIVWHTADGAALPELGGRACFKAISNKWLLKHG